MNLWYPVIHGFMKVLTHILLYILVWLPYILSHIDQHFFPKSMIKKLITTISGTSGFLIPWYLINFKQKHIDLYSVVKYTLNIKTCTTLWIMITKTGLPEKNICLNSLNKVADWLACQTCNQRMAYLVRQEFEHHQWPLLFPWANCFINTCTTWSTEGISRVILYLI